MKKEYIIISIFAFVSLLICICLSIEQRINEYVYPTETTIEAIKVDSISSNRQSNSLHQSR